MSTSILAGLVVAVEPIVEEAKVWAEKAVDFLKEVPITLTQKAVALVKETSLGTAIANLISLANGQTTVSGANKFDAIVSAAEAAYEAFVGAGGLSGLIATGVSILRQLVQSLYDDFVQVFAPPAAQPATAA